VKFISSGLFVVGLLLVFWIGWSVAPAFAYVLDAGCNCPLYKDWNLHVPHYVDGEEWVLVASAFADPTSNWQEIETDIWREADPWHGVEVRQYLYNLMTYYSWETYVSVDNVRVRSLP